MKNIITKGKTIIIKNKYIILGILILIIPFLLLIMSNPGKNHNQQQSASNPSINPIPTIVLLPGKITNIQLIQLDGKDRPELRKKEFFAEGIIKYSYDSSIPKRSDILITKNGEPVFQETISIPDFPVPFSYYSKYGQPEQIIKGSRFYGQDIETYVYASQGLALIIDPQTDIVLELQLFPSTSIDNYVRAYGEDILNPKDVDTKIIPITPFDMDEP